MVRLSDVHILPRGLGRGLGVDSVDTYNQATVERFSLAFPFAHMKVIRNMTVLSSM